MVKGEDQFLVHFIAQPHLWPHSLRECWVCHTALLQVVKGEDQFLVRWETFGPYWDEWVSAYCLNAAPHTYDWEGGSAAMPAKFKPGKGK
jgi:hypothetical protein